MSPRYLCLAVFVLAASLTGCNPAGKLIGKWKVESASGGTEATMAALLLQSTNLQVEFKTDGVCVISSALGGGTGSWRFIKSESNALVVAIKMPPSNAEQETRIEFTDNDHCRMTPPNASVQTKSAALNFVRDK